MTDLVALCIGTGVLIVAYLQWRLAERKLVFDLFNRRYAIYAEAKKFIGAVGTQGTATTEELIAFHHNTREAEFLFKRSIGEYLDELIDKAELRRDINKQLANERTPQDTRRKLAEQDTQASEYFRAQYMVLAERFRPYLAMEQEAQPLRQRLPI